MDRMEEWEKVWGHLRFEEPTDNKGRIKWVMKNDYNKNYVHIYKDLIKDEHIGNVLRRIFIEQDRPDIYPFLEEVHNKYKNTIDSQENSEYSEEFRRYYDS